MDGSTYVANQTNVITLSNPDAYYNDVGQLFVSLLIVLTLTSHFRFRATSVQCFSTS